MLSPGKETLYPNCDYSMFPFHSTISKLKSVSLLLGGLGKFSQCLVICVLLKRKAPTYHLSVSPPSPSPIYLIDSCLEQMVLTCFSNRLLSWVSPTLRNSYFGGSANHWAQGQALVPTHSLLPGLPQ